METCNKEVKYIIPQEYANLTEGQEIDLAERIAIRTIDGTDTEEEATEKALAELESWWQDLAT